MPRKYTVHELKPDGAEPKDGNDEAAVRRLAALPEFEYDRAKKTEAESLGVSVPVLDKAVKAERKKQQQDSGEDEVNDLGLFNPAPCEHPVDGGVLLDGLVNELQRYVVLPLHAAECAALWAVHTHCFENWHHTPRLSVRAPTKNSGKSTLLDVISNVVPRALQSESVSTAVIFRVIEKHKPVLLIDEVDTFLSGNEELRGALNAGHKRGAKHLRCEGDDHTVKAFSTFAPVALSGIGKLPATLTDRSVIVSMQRKKPDEHVEDFRGERAHTPP